MEYIDSWVFNRGQEITLRKGPKNWHVSVQLFNSEGYPFKYLHGPDKEKLLLRAMELVKEDVAKDNQTVLLLDEAYDHGINLTDFPIPVRSESQELREWVETPEVQEIVGGIRKNIHLHELEKQWRKGED